MDERRRRSTFWGHKPTPGELVAIVTLLLAIAIPVAGGWWFIQAWQNAHKTDAPAFRLMDDSELRHYGGGARTPVEAPDVDEATLDSVQPH